MYPKIAFSLLPMAVAAALSATVHAQELSDEQRAEIEARIAPVGSVCVQGSDCGGLPESLPVAVSSKPATEPADSNSADSSSTGNAASGPSADVAASGGGSGSDSAASSDEAGGEMAASGEDDGADSSSEDGSGAAGDSESEEVAAASGASATNAATVASAGPAIDGEAIYNQACMACHMSGVGGAPVVGDIDSWAPRIAKGIEALHNSGLKGVAGTAMMAKGGRMDLSDQEVMAAVDYMVSSSQ